VKKRRIRHQKKQNKKRAKSDDKDGDNSAPKKRAKLTGKSSRTRVTHVHSLEFVRLYTEHKKHWSHFFADDEVKKLIKRGGYDQHQIQQHLSYLKRRMGTSTTKGNKHRQKIFDALLEGETNGDNVSVEPLNPDNNLESDEEQEELGSQRLEMLDALEQDMIDDVAVSSSDIQDSDDFKSFTSTQKDKKKIRGSRIARKAEEKQQMVQLMREQNEGQEQAAQMRMMTNTLLLQWMQRAVVGLDALEKQPEQDDVSSRCDGLEKKIDDLNVKMSAILDRLPKDKVN